MSDEDQDKQVEESKQRQKDQLSSEAKSLANQGFTKEQIAAQLSSKHQITVEEATAAIGDDDAQPKDDA